MANDSNKPKLEGYKEKQYLVFKKENQKEVKFNLSTGEFIGVSGRPVVSLNTQLSGYTIKSVIESFSDENYRDFLNFLYRKCEMTCYNNLGTFLKHVRRNLHLEQYFSSGLKNVSVSKDYKITDIPRTLLNYFRSNPDYNLTDWIVSEYKKNQNMADNIIKMESDGEFLSTLSYYNLVNAGYCYASNFLHLINVYNYKPQALVKYIDNIMFYEGMDRIYDVLLNLKDYAYMNKEMGVKFEKYPRYLKTMHDITSRNFKRRAEKYNEEIFSTRIDTTKEWKYKGWSFIYPKNTSEIKEEGVNQSNCVGSYVNHVINGVCDIIFMRRTGDKDKSYITIEVRKDKCVQCKRRFNAEPTESDWAIIKKYENYLQNRNKNKKLEQTA